MNAMTNRIGALRVLLWLHRPVGALLYSGHLALALVEKIIDV
jgi:hypothetical protein